jgi:hypothetical protein
MQLLIFLFTDHVPQKEEVLTNARSLASCRDVCLSQETGARKTPPVH